MTPIAIYSNSYFGDYAYIRICPICQRFVKADPTSFIPEILRDEPNATCKRCGRVQMEFYDWLPEKEEDNAKTDPT